MASCCEGRSPKTQEQITCDEMMSRNYPGISSKRKAELVSVFKKIDKNNSGVIDNDEAIANMVQHGLRGAADGVGDHNDSLRQLAKMAAETFVHDMDTNKDSNIDFAEFVKAGKGGMYWHLHHFQQAKLRQEKKGGKAVAAAVSEAEPRGCMDVGSVEPTTAHVDKEITPKEPKWV